MFLDVAEVVNRRNMVVEEWFDGKPLTWGPFEKKALPKVVALCLVQQTALQIDMATGIRSGFALGITGDPFWPTDPLPGELAERNPVEALNREGEEGDTESQTVAMEGGEVGEVLKEKKAKGKFEAKVTGIQEPKGPQSLGHATGSVVSKTA